MLPGMLSDSYRQAELKVGRLRVLGGYCIHLGMSSEGPVLVLDSQLIEKVHRRKTFLESRLMIVGRALLKMPKV